VHKLGFGSLVDTQHLRSLQRPAEEDANFEKALFGAHEEVAGLA
jgi:hypothetical protein